jgi:hypothetical protein
MLSSISQKKFGEKYLVIGFDVRNNLAYLNFVPNSMSFEIMFRFHPEFKFKGSRYIGTLCSPMQIQ